MQEPFMRVLKRNGVYYMHQDSVKQLQTGKVLMRNREAQLEEVQTLKHYHGMFLEALESAGIIYSDHGKYLKLRYEGLHKV